MMPSPLPRTYLVAGTQEPFFLDNAARGADALRDTGALLGPSMISAHRGGWCR